MASSRSSPTRNEESGGRSAPTAALGAWGSGGCRNGIGEVLPVDVFVPDSTLALWIGPPLAFLGLVLCLGTAGGPRRWGVLVLLMTSVGLDPDNASEDPATPAGLRVVTASPAGETAVTTPPTRRATRRASGKQPEAGAWRSPQARVSRQSGSLPRWA